MESQIQHNFEDDHEKDVSHKGDLLFELREVTAQDQVHDLLALVLWQKNPDRNPQLNRRSRDERDIRHDPIEFGEHHESDTVNGGNARLNEVQIKMCCPIGKLTIS